MPLPTPSQNEKQSDFHSCCMGDEAMKKEYPDQKQRNAVCYSQWDKSHSSSPKSQSLSLHQYPHLTERLFNTPLYITQNKLNEILHFLGDKLTLNVPSPDMEIRSHKIKQSDDSLYLISDNTAIIPVTGTLVHKGDFMDAISCVTSYQHLYEATLSALHARDVDTLLFDVDSDGGEGSGLFDFVDFLYSIRGRKPMIGVANEKALSAAYAIISSMDEVYLSRTAAVGSIGAVILHKDLSQALDKAGIKVTAIYSGKHKTDLASFKPLSEDVKAQLQEQVDNARNMFVQIVARNNNLSIDAVSKTEAAIFVGEEAVKHDLATGLKSYNEVLSYTMTYNRKRKGGLLMAREGKVEVPDIEPQTSEEKIYTKAEYDSVIATYQETMNASISAEVEKQVSTKLEASTKEAIDAALKLERERVHTIISTCVNAGLPELAMDHINNGATVETVNTMLITTLAVKSNAQTITSINNPSLSGSVGNPLLEDAQKRAKEYFNK